jgi:3-hydroxyacyl-CoA dehydrogenase
LHAIVQSPANAFAVNRLLLPLQAEAVRALRAGWPAAVVDGASATPLAPYGQLALMDAVGLDVIAAAVANYRRRLPPGEARDYTELGETLESLLASGKRGKKNRNGFLSGSPLPWAVCAPSPGETAELAYDFRALAASTCTRAIESGDIDAENLDLAFSSLFAATVPLDEERRRCRDSSQVERLARLRRVTGRSYFLPETRCRPTMAAR